ncbi:hypothetical protein PG985_011625 [Apiospora marii]|uniref:uncharacterized protein n=1 Tax=Apiospora marii TaxID=335849 RepID=UPI0031302143
MEETNTDPSEKRKSTPNMGILATAKLSKNWRKAVDAVRRTIQASKSATTKKAHPLFRSRSRSRGGPGVTCTNVTPEASQAARFTRAVNEAVYSPYSPHHGWAGRLYPGGSRRYRSVKVLLAFWAETDDPAFGAVAVAHALADVFRGRYGFDVLVWLIPVMQPQQALAAKLQQFAREVDRRHLPGEDLLIFWYGGSAREGEAGGGPLWYGENFGGPTIDSQIVPQILGAARSDVLTLYDTPHALHGHAATGPGVYEHLGASAHDDIIAGFVGESSSTSYNGSRTPLSFTHALIQILDKPDRAARGIAVLDIHRKLVNRYRMASAAVADSRASESDEEEEEKEEAPPTTTGTNSGGHHYNKRRSRGENAYTTSPQPWLPRALRQTPVYCHLSRCRPRSEGGGPTSIVLSQLGRPAPETFLEPRPAPPHGPEGVGGEKGENGDGDDGAAEVTMRLRLRAPADAADIGRWKEWILDAPPEASQLVFIQAKPT